MINYFFITAAIFFVIIGLICIKLMAEFFQKDQDFYGYCAIILMVFCFIGAVLSLMCSGIHILWQ